MEWKPISEAPRDGRRILAADFERDYVAVMVATGAEWECVAPNGEPMRFGFYPTHFTALPEPPK